MINIVNKIIKTIKTISVSKHTVDVPNMEERLAELQKRIDYNFRSIELLKLAITHDSVARAHDGETTNSPYERM